MKSTSIILILVIILSSCVSSKNISSFDCSYSSNGTNRVSESIVLKPKIKTIKGVDLIPQYPSSTQLISRYDNRTSNTLKEYNIKIIGGTRVRNTAEIIVDRDPTDAINKRLQVFISLKKDKHFADTIDFIVDYKGRFSLNFDTTNPASHAKNVFVNVQKLKIRHITLISIASFIKLKLQMEHPLNPT
jgi:hypothetical protein